MLAITPTRDGISDRFPHLSFVVRVPPSRWFEVACATDPRLLWPQYAAYRRADNFATSRAQGLMRAAAGEAVYLVPPEQLRSFAGASRLYYALGTYLAPDGADPVLTAERAERVPWVRIGGDFTGRSLRAAPSRARYGGAAPAPLTWGGDRALATHALDVGAPAPLTTSCWPSDLPTESASLAVGLQALGVNAFPSRYPSVFTDDNSLQLALDGALAQMRIDFPAFAARRLSIAIASIHPDPAVTARFAGNRADDMDFIASTGKLLSMYAAFELRKAVNAVATAGTWSDGDQLKALLDAELDPQIRDKVASIPNHALPRYREIFDLGGATRGTPIAFSTDFQSWLNGSIGDGDNGASSQVINRLGFQYINGCLGDGGFFDGTSGLWLTGNFVSTPLRLARSVNDGLVGQAGSARQLAALMTRIANGTLVDGTASTAMQALLRTQVANSTPWMLRGATPVSFTAVYNKVGVADLKAENGGGSIYSEAGVVLHSSGLRFAVAWTNGRLTAAGWDPIGRLVDKTINDYINSP
jgi:hypothetical protein